LSVLLGLGIGQAAISGLLLHTPSEFYDDTLKSLKAGAELCYRRVQCITGLDCPTFPQGAMYIMVGLLYFLSFLKYIIAVIEQIEKL
jgi:aspartate/methionine/tyrosine aminotransferase